MPEGDFAEHAFDVIDVNHQLRDINLHLLTDEYRYVEHAFFENQDTGRELRTRLTSMNAQRVRAAVISAASTYLQPRGIADTMAVNDAVAAYRDATPDRFVAAVGHVDPLHGHAGIDEVSRCKDDLGLVGIRFQGMGFMMRPVVQRAAEVGLVPFIHVGQPNETIWQVDSLAKHFPDLPMIVLGVFHDISQIGSLAEVAERRPNLYFDLSGSTSFETIGLPQLRPIGAHRFLYGTATRSWPIHTKPFGELLADIMACDLPNEDKVALLGGNAKQILGL